MGTRHTMYYMDKEYPNIPIGGGAGGGGSSFVKLAEYTDSGAGYAAGSTITLSQDITNFDILLFSVVWQSGTDGFSSGTVVVDDFINKYTARMYANYSGAGYVDVLYLSNTSISVLRTGGEFVHAVYGVKFGSGGGGGGSQTTKDDLFTNTGTTNPATITFDNPLTDYDEIRFMIRAGSNAIATMTYDVENLIAGDTIGAGFYTGVFAWYYYTDSQTLTFRVSAGGGYISNIVGIKY